MAEHSSGYARYSIAHSNRPTVQIRVKGRNRWALERLMQAREAGCTPLTHPGPRWSGYVHNLREMGVQIETITEPHDGPYPGTHGRYVLRCTVARIEEGGA